MTKQYGTVYKDVFLDNDISIEAKAIYGYLCAYAGSSTECYPSVALMCSELGITENRFRRHFGQLVDKGYVSVSKRRGGKGFSRNVYSVEKPGSVSRQNEGATNSSDSISMSRQNVAPQNEGTTNSDFVSMPHQNDVTRQNEGIQNRGTTISSFTNPARPFQGRGGEYRESLPLANRGTDDEFSHLFVERDELPEAIAGPDEFWSASRAVM